MNLENIDLNKVASLISEQLEQVTCTECCKYYLEPTTAKCGHTLCHSCWIGRRSCHSCGMQIEKKNLKINLPVQNLKQNVQRLVLSFEKLYNIKLEEFLLDAPNVKEPIDSAKHVKEWLGSSQNKFSAPITDSQNSTQDPIHPVEVICDIQIHSENKKIPKPLEVIHIPSVQEGWDKIEEVQEMENFSKNEENPVGPMDIEPFDFIDNEREFSSDNPRRSSRNKENKSIATSEISSDKNKDKSSTVGSDNKSNKVGKNWNTVKRMKKEFSKLNKNYRNKLNVSIEMCKKTQAVGNKEVLPHVEQSLYDIDDNTPEISNNNTKGEINNYSKNSTTASKADKNNCRSNVDEETTNELNITNNKQHNKDLSRSVTNISKDREVKNNSIIQKNADASSLQKKCNNIVSNMETVNQKICFFKKSALTKANIMEESRKTPHIELEENCNTNSVNTDDIEITIKIGNTLTNICIKKKENDVQLKVTSDREIQTSHENMNDNKINTSSMTNKGETVIENQSTIKLPDKINNIEQNTDPVIKVTTPNGPILNRSVSTKKNTSSADTATAQFEITESVERELNDIDNVFSNEKARETEVLGTKRQSLKTQRNIIPEDREIEDLNDFDIFDGESVKEGNVKSLKPIKKTPSTILMPTVKSNKIKSQKDKRNRDMIDAEDLPSKKKMKMVHDGKNNKPTPTTNKIIEEQNVIEDSENMNYDAVLNQVFANIDAEMNNMGKTNEPAETLVPTQASIRKANNDDNEYENQKCSENIFSMLEKVHDSEILETSKGSAPVVNKNDNEALKITGSNRLDKGASKQYSTNDVDIIELSTPHQMDDDDKSIVEETPQKSTSFSKNKNRSDLTITNTQQLISKNIKQLKGTENRKDNIEDTNVINLSESLQESTKNSKNATVIETIPRMTTETPMTITKFVDQIKYKSTPLARKSLNFNIQNDDDPEQTLCPSSIVAAKTTQEKEFMSKAFNQSQNSPLRSSFIECRRKGTKYCIGGSCLSPSEQANLKLLCVQRNWTYVEKYCKELTHLVVRVDEDNVSQRSIKFICALAGAKWIVSYQWAEKCLQTNTIIDEEPFEALDVTGDPGPRRSRIAKHKLLQGIKFYCMPPFSVLDIDTLKIILELAGGSVTSEIRDVSSADTPALLLAEPEHTQEDRFTYLAMELSVVPVNYEWVVNCLGSYTLSSIYDLLLCPASILPPTTAKWPPELLTPDDD